MSPEEQAAVAQMMIGVRTSLLGVVQQLDGLLRLLAKDAGPQAPERKIPRVLGGDETTEQKHG